MAPAARKQLEQALAQAEDLQSQYWINHVNGALAAAYLQLQELVSADKCLARVLTKTAPMDTLGKR